MVERERPERKDVRILGDTTFKEVGIEPSNDPLNLASDKVTLAVLDNKRFVFVKHPLAGGHLAQFLNVPAPFKRQDKLGVSGDLTMPINAAEAVKKGMSIRDSNDLRLHTRHIKDPDISDLYQEFISLHVNRWLEVLYNNYSWDVFDQLQRIKFVKSISDFTSELSLQWEDIFSSDVDKKSKVYDFGVTASSYYKKGKPFDSFLKRSKRRKRIYGYEPLQLNGFFKQLTEEEKEEFAIEYSTHQEERVLVDLEGKSIFRNKDRNGLSKIGQAIIQFVDEEFIQIKDNEGTAVEVVPNGDNWKVVSYRFSPNYRASSLYPLIAWDKNDNGQRRFLRQSEVQPYLERLDLQGAKRSDVKLGEIEVASSSSNITDKWKKKFSLTPLEGQPQDDFEQSMMGAQMAVWVRMLHHGEELLSDENPFWEIEKHMGAA